MSPALHPIGDSFGEYGNLKLEHQGGQGRIYSGTRDGKRFALKFSIRCGAISSADRLMWEGKLGTLLHHPNLPRADRVGVQDGILYVAFEWIDGASLHELMENGRIAGDVLSREEIAYLLSEILAALHHVHSALVAHLDVSPDNIVISLDGSPKLVDFGISTVADGSPLDTCVGKPPYMAPELLQGGASPRSDQYGLGVVAAELAGGDVEVVPIGVPATLPAGLRSLIGRMLAADPAGRFASCEEARAQLHAHVGWIARWRGHRALRARVRRHAPPAARARALAAAVTRARRNAVRVMVVMLIAAAVTLLATL